MGLVTIDRDPSRRDLRIFGLTGLAFLAAAGGWTLLKGHPPLVAAAIWTSGGVLAIAGAAIPGFTRKAYLAVSYATYPIGWVVSHALLGAIYYLVFTPLGAALRIFGHDPLRRRFDRTAGSYWIDRGAERPVESYFRQF